MLMLALVAIATLAANGARQLRYTAIAFLGVALAAHLLGGPSLSLAQVAVTATAAITTAGILFIAARDGRFGEDPSWRLWVATVVAASATAGAFAFLRTTSNEEVRITLLGDDPSGVTHEAAAF